MLPTRNRAVIHGTCGIAQQPETMQQPLYAKPTDARQGKAGNALSYRR